MVSLIFIILGSVKILTLFLLPPFLGADTSVGIPQLRHHTDARLGGAGGSDGVLQTSEATTWLTNMTYGGDKAALIKEVDVDNDKKIDDDELATLVSKAMKDDAFKKKFKEIEDQTVAILVAMDTNNDGNIDRTEFNAFAKKAELVSDDVFGVIDFDKNKSIDVPELMAYLLAAEGVSDCDHRTKLCGEALKVVNEGKTGTAVATDLKRPGSFGKTLGGWFLHPYTWIIILWGTLYIIVGLRMFDDCSEEAEEFDIDEIDDEADAKYDDGNNVKVDVGVSADDRSDE